MAATSSPRSTSRATRPAGRSSSPGLAVMISIGGLFLLDDPLFRSMAIGTISVVLVAVIGSLTFLPATLAILGDGVNRLSISLILARDREEGSGFWAIVVRRVMRRPVIAAAGTAMFLLALATPVLRLHMGQADFSSFPDTLDGVQAVNMLNEKWPSGSELELDRRRHPRGRGADEGGDREALAGGPRDRRDQRADHQLYLDGRARRARELRDGWRQQRHPQSGHRPRGPLDRGAGRVQRRLERRGVRDRRCRRRPSTSSTSTPAACR